MRRLIVTIVLCSYHIINGVIIVRLFVTFFNDMTRINVCPLRVPQVDRRVSGGGESCGGGSIGAAAGGVRAVWCCVVYVRRARCIPVRSVRRRGKSSGDHGGDDR